MKKVILLVFLAACLVTNMNITKGNELDESGNTLLMSSDIQTEKKAIPGPTTNVKAQSIGTSSVKLTWETVNGAEGYIIYRQIGKGKFEYRYMVSGTSFTDTTAKTGEFNYYRVYPYVTVNGKREVGPSTTYTYAKPVPSSATNIKAVSTSATTVKLTWSPVSNVDGYIIYRQIGTGKFEYRYIVTGTSFTDTTAKTGEYNYYRVYPYKRVNGKQIVGLSSSYVYTKPIPTAVSNLKVSKPNSSSIKLTWGPVSNVDGYIIYRQAPGESKMSYRYMVKGNSFIDTNVAASGYYYYRVYSYKNVNGKQIVSQSKSYVYTQIPKRIIKYPEGMYKVGKDIPAGEYIVIQNSDLSGYFEVNSSLDGGYKTIVSNGIVNGNSYLVVQDGQYLTVSRGNLYPATNAPVLDTTKEGMFKVGVDIPAGEYNIQSNNNIIAYYEITNDASGKVSSIVANDNFKGNRIITVTNGQYLQVNRGKLTKMK